MVSSYFRLDKSNMLMDFDRQLLRRLWFSSFGSWQTFSIGYSGFVMIERRHDDGSAHLDGRVLLDRL